MLALWWWRVYTLRLSLIGIHMTFVVSLHINRWLCRDNVQHIVPTIMHPCTHECISSCACVCVCVLLILNQSEGYLLISLFQKGSAGAFQVSWAGIPEQTSTHAGLAKNSNNKTNSWFALLSLPGKGSPACPCRFPLHSFNYLEVQGKMHKKVYFLPRRIGGNCITYMSPVCVNGVFLAL